MQNPPPVSVDVRCCGSSNRQGVWTFTPQPTRLGRCDVAFVIGENCSRSIPHVASCGTGRRLAALANPLSCAFQLIRYMKSVEPGLPMGIRPLAL
jgi:hypothetical protein